MRCLVRLLVVSVAVGLPGVAGAQSSEAEVSARLVGKPLYLRGFWLSDKLNFDAAGQFVGKPGVTSFTLAGVEIDSVKMTGKRLMLDGHRVGLEFEKDVPKRVTLEVKDRFGQGTHPEAMHLEVERSASGDFGPALDAVFAASLGEIAGTLPDYWQDFARKHFIEGAVGIDPRHEQPTPSRGVMRVGGSLSPPRVLKSSEPSFDEAARALKYSGIVMTYLHVDKQGLPVHLRILRPLGLGLDERALAAVASYRFAPAMLGNEPVVVEMNIEVNFQIF